MNNQDCVNDLIAVKEAFMEQSQGSYPVCLDYAIAQLAKSDVAKWEPQTIMTYRGKRVVAVSYGFKCPNCGLVKFEATKFCPDCGKSLKA